MIKSFDNYNSDEEFNNNWNNKNIKVIIKNSKLEFSKELEKKKKNDEINNELENDFDNDIIYNIFIKVKEYCYNNSLPFFDTLSLKKLEEYLNTKNIMI